MNLQSAVIASPIRSTYADDPEYRELIEIFLDAAPERARELTTVFAAGNFDELRQKAHQLKGAGGGFGFQGLTDLAAALERACRDRDPERIAAALREAVDYLGRIVL